MADVRSCRRCTSPDGWYTVTEEFEDSGYSEVIRIISEPWQRIQQFREVVHRPTHFSWRGACRNNCCDHTFVALDLNRHSTRGKFVNQSAQVAAGFVDGDSFHVHFQ